MNDLYMLRQMLNGHSSDWLMVGYMLVLFGVCLFKPERVRSSMIFRWACTLFVLSFLLPTMMQAVMEGLGMAPVTPYRSRGVVQPSVTFIIIGGLQPILMGLSMFFAFAALSPKQVTEKRNQPAPTRHPLD